MTAIAIEQTKPTLLAPGDKPPDSPNGSTPAPGEPGAEPAVVSKAYSEEWVRKLLTYCCNSLATEYATPELKITVIELELMTPALTAVLNAHAPDVVSGTDPRASVIFVCLMIVVMGGRRAMIIARKKRSEKRNIAGKPKESSPGKSPPGTTDQSIVPTGGAFGSEPVTLGGSLS